MREQRREKVGGLHIANRAASGVNQRKSEFFLSCLRAHVGPDYLYELKPLKGEWSQEFYHAQE